MGNTEVYRDWGWAPEYIKIIYKIMNSSKPSDYIIATGKITKLDDIVTKVFNHYKLQKKNFLKKSNNFNRKLEPMQIKADITKLKKKLNYAPKILIDAIISSMIAEEKSGSIINVASQAGHRGEALVAHYCATKAAVISYTQSAALALASNKIRVNAISPGVIDTPMWDHVDKLFAKFEKKEIGQKKREVGKAVPLGFMGRPKDVARAAVFLASDQSEYITAQTICVDGGNVLR